MKLSASQFELSASDLAAHLGCRHLTQLDRQVAEGRIKAPVWRAPGLETLAQRGLDHEEAYLDDLRNERGLELRVIESEGITPEGFEQTKAAMRDGAAAIVQATLIDGRWRGRADVLLRVEEASDLGAWSYEVVDTKLASETRGGTVLQICLYSDLVARVQGRMPQRMHVVTPRKYDEPETFRVQDYLAYCRLIRGKLESAVDVGGTSTYPDPVPHCDVCRWWQECNARWHADDHLSLVAGIGRVHRKELEARGVGTLTGLAEIELPIEPRPARGAIETYEKIHHQAGIQLASREHAVPLHELLLPIEEGLGLARLPEPSPGDVFLDLEGDPFVEGGGREYLFGWVTLGADGQPEYHARWALDADAERRGFEALIDTLIARWDVHPGFHVYHFAPYEPAALKRLMGRYATREEELDRLLRGGRFVDLYAVVRQGVRIGVESYNLKELERLHAFARQVVLREAGVHRRLVERALELGEAEEIPAESRVAVQQYNEDDCVSTLSLRSWLEKLRAEEVARGTVLPRPEKKSEEAPEKQSERTKRIRQLFERLVGGVPALAAERAPEQQARWLLAHLLEWHRREDKATWWELFRLAELDEEDLREERHGLAGLRFIVSVGGTVRCPIHRYAFPAQDHDIRAHANLRMKGGEHFGKVDAIDLAGRTIDVKKKETAKDEHPTAIFVHDHVGTDVFEDAIERLGNQVADHGMDAPGSRRAARDLLLRRPPRLASGFEGALHRDGEELLDAAARLALDLRGGVLAVQGPPGSGKTYMGARMICALVRAGRKVGVTATSHKVIRNLLDEVLAAAKEEGTSVSILQKGGDSLEFEAGGIREAKKNEDALAALRTGSANVVGGTGWLWSREEFERAVDVLVVDEAGQMSLANVLAVAGAAESVILLGDPQQLEQPIQGSHPDGAEASALQHLLEAHQTIPDDRGLFLAESWRLHPDLCSYTSEIFYEGRLGSRPGCEQQKIEGPTPFAGAGPWLVPLQHEGNQSASAEEADAIKRIVDSLLQSGVSWIDRSGKREPLREADILVVAPYNAQVALLLERLPGLRVGTVDKFQGQEAPVVIYSVTTSSAEDAPRGMEFLYSLHRLNVATSRARCVSIVVASTRVLEPDCRTPHQMRLANALCRYAELARESTAR